MKSGSKCAPAVTEDFQRPRDRQGRAVGARGGERVEAVGDGDEAGEKRDLRAAEAVGVAAAVHAFVMAADGGEDGAAADHRGENAFAGAGMLADDGVLLGRERAGLVQDGVGDGDLADVVQLGGQAEEPSLFAVRGRWRRPAASA